MSFALQLVLVLVVFSWLSIRLLEKRNIFASWLTPANLRLKEFTFGFLLMGALYLLSQLFFTYMSNVSWAVSEEITVSKFLSSSLADVNSVLIEELVFRGVIFYGLITYVSQRVGLIISVIAFGIMHWFSYGVLGNVLGMVLVFITTGLMGYVFARAYIKTKSIVLPVGLHLGWNWVNGSIFSNGLSGTVLLVPSSVVPMEGFFAMISFFWYLMIPVVVLLFLKTEIFDRIISRTSNNRVS
jgi:membrane protease YdiL (CAAX protease family)